MSAGATAAMAEAPLTSIRPMPRAALAGPAVVLRRAPGIDALIAEAALGGEIGFSVADAKTGLVLEARNPALALPPASVLKSVTSLYAFQSLGLDHVFTTRLLATGGLLDGKIKGDLILAGAGDPTLDTDALAGMVQALKALGVRGITGRFRVFAGALPYVKSIDPEQPDHLGYNPAVSGLNLNFNRVHFQWTRAGEGYTVEMDARSERYRPPVSVARMQIVKRDLPVYTYAAGGAGEDNWTVAQSALGNGGSRWLPVRRPDLYAGEVFQALARAEGVALPNPEAMRAVPTGTPLVTHSSPNLSAMARDMLNYSTNITAEALGLSATAARGVAAGDLAASGAAMRDWMTQTLGVSSARFHDHSGLSDQSRIAARDLVTMLLKAGPAGPLAAHLKEMQPKDAEGKVLAQPAHRIQAKTGTLNFVSTLAGYVTAPDGNVLAFSILTGDLPRRAALTRAERERPQGARSWAGRARWLQHQLINRWVSVYGA